MNGFNQNSGFLDASLSIVSSKDTPEGAIAVGNPAKVPIQTSIFQRESVKQVSDLKSSRS